MRTAISPRLAMRTFLNGRAQRHDFSPYLRVTRSGSVARRGGRDASASRRRSSRVRLRSRRRRRSPGRRPSSRPRSPSWCTPRSRRRAGRRSRCARTPSARASSPRAARTSWRRRSRAASGAPSRRQHGPSTRETCWTRMVRGASPRFVTKSVCASEWRRPARTSMPTLPGVAVVAVHALLMGTTGSDVCAGGPSAHADAPRSRERRRGAERDSRHPIELSRSVRE